VQASSCVISDATIKYNAQKHRKRMAEKVKRDDAKKSKITNQEVKEDKSEGKVVTHKQ